MTIPSTSILPHVVSQARLQARSVGTRSILQPPSATVSAFRASERVPSVFEPVGRHVTAADIFGSGVPDLPSSDVPSLVAFEGLGAEWGFTATIGPGGADVTTTADASAETPKPVAVAPTATRTSTYSTVPLLKVEPIESGETIAEMGTRISDIVERPAILLAQQQLRQSLQPMQTAVELESASSAVRKSTDPLVAQLQDAQRQAQTSQLTRSMATMKSTPSTGGGATVVVGALLLAAVGGVVAWKMGVFGKKKAS